MLSAYQSFELRRMAVCRCIAFCTTLKLFMFLGRNESLGGNEVEELWNAYQLVFFSAHSLTSV
jgi:hypothetical protein